MANEVLKGFLVSLGFKVDEQGQKKFKEVIQGAVLQANLLASAVEAAAVVVAKGLFGMSDSFDKLYFASRRTGASVQNIRALSYAFTQVGGSSGEASAAVENFAKAMRTNPGVGGFVRSLGVATQAGGKARDTIEVLMDSIDAIRKRNPHYVGAQLAGILGIDEHQFLLLEKSRDEIRKYRAEYDKTARMMGLNNDQAAESHNKMATAMRSLSMIVTVAADRLLTMLAPAMDRVVKAITAWVQSNPEKIETIFNGIAKAAEWLGEKLIWLADKAAEMAADGRWLKMWDRTVKAVQDAAEAVKSIVHWLGVLNGMTPGKIVSSILGISDAQAAEVGGARVTRAGAGGESPGMLRRGWNAVKRAFGGGVANAGEAEGAPADGIRRRGARAAVADKANYNFTGENADVLRQAAKELGTSPKDLATVISYESGFNSKRWGGKGGNYMGLIQFGPSERKQFGANDQQSFKEQMPAVVRYLKTRGFKPGMGLLDLYSTINAGSPGRYNASDGNGTVRSHVARMQAQHAARVERFLASGSKPEPPAPPPPKPLNLPSMPRGAFSPGQGGFDVNKMTAPAAPMGGNSSVDNSSNRTINQTNNTTVKIEAAGDPVAAGRHTERAIGRTSALNLRNMQTAIA